MPNTLISHINSYYISSSLHAELLKELSSYDAIQDVFVPIVPKELTDAKAPESHPNTRVTYSQCFGILDKFLWPNKIRKIRNAFFNHIYKHNPKLIHAHSLLTNGLIALLYYRKYNTPYIVSVRYTDVHVFMKKSAIFRRIGYLVLENAENILFLSPAYLNHHIPILFGNTRFEAIRKKSCIIPNGIHPFWLENRNMNIVEKPSGSVHRVLFAGTLTKRKNPLAVLKACDLLNQEGFRTEMHVVGQGHLKNKLKKHRGPTAVHLHGFISDKERLKSIYRSSDMLVVPSFRETFGLVYAEAMSQGLPVIYSRNEGFDGFFEDGQVGYAVNPGDVYEIASRMKGCINNREKLGRQAVDSSGKFNWESLGSQMAACYGIERLQSTSTS